MHATTKVPPKQVYLKSLAFEPEEVEIPFAPFRIKELLMISEEYLAFTVYSRNPAHKKTVVTTRQMKVIAEFD